MADRLLIKQHLELAYRPLDGIEAAPVDLEKRRWCGNIFFAPASQYPGLILHFTMDFGPDWPNEPPSIWFPHTFTHNGQRGCLHWFLPITAPEKTAPREHKKDCWNPSRSVRSILALFRDFLTHEEGTIGRADREEIFAAAAAHKCPRCGHTAAAPSPPKSAVLPISALPIPEDITGFGLSFDGGTAHSDLSAVTYTAVSIDGIRRTSRGNCFEYWMPFVLDEAHWVVARPLAEGMVSLMLGCPFTPEAAALVIQGFFSEWADKLARSSERVVGGLCSLHHLALAMAHAHPRLREMAFADLAALADDPGLLIPPSAWSFFPMLKNTAAVDFSRASDVLYPLLLADFPLARIMPSLAQAVLAWEALDRHKSFSAYEDFVRADDAEKVRLLWQERGSALRRSGVVLGFACLAAATPGAETLKRYNAGMNFVAQLYAHCRAFEACRDFAEWFALLGLPCPSDSALVAMFEKALAVASERVKGSRPRRIKITSRYAAQSPDHRLAVTGSIPELGDWGRAGFIPMSRNAGLWSCEVMVPSDRSYEWKLVLVDAEKKILRWEARPNRCHTTLYDEQLEVSWDE